MNKRIIIILAGCLVVRLLVSGSKVNQNGQLVEVDQRIDQLTQENNLLEEKVATLLSITQLASVIDESYQPYLVTGLTNHEITYNYTH